MAPCKYITDTNLCDVITLFVQSSSPLKDRVSNLRRSPPGLEGPAWIARAFRGEIWDQEKEKQIERTEGSQLIFLSIYKGVQW